MSKPLFVLLSGGKAADNRVFRNDTCVFNTRLGMVYSGEEIVEVLNQRDYYSKVMDLMQDKIWYMQGMYNRTGNNIYKNTEQILQELRDELYEPYNSDKKYADILEQWFKESMK